MKRFITTLSALVLALTSLAATARADVKVATVNMAELNIKYYKRAESQALLNKQEATAREEVQQRQEKLRSLNEEAQKLQAQFDPTLSESAQKSLREKAAAIKNEFDAAQEELKTFAQRRQVALREIVRREQQLIAKDMQDAVTAVSAEGGYDIVLDVSAVSATGYRAVPFAKPEMDITAAVLARLNADAPADFDPNAEMERVRAAAGLAPEAPAAQ